MQKNQIDYSLLAGSMLGAVRHGGFIPWDDDLDIGMTRANYELFLKACERDLNSEKFDLQTFSTDENYPYPFAKILLKGTYLVEYGHENTKYRKGLFVDIFPFDAVPDGRCSQKLQALLVTTLKKQLILKEIRPNSTNTLKNCVYAVVSIVNKIVSKKTIYHLLYKTQTRYGANRTKKLSNMIGYYGYEKETLPTEIFDSYTYIKFENRNYQTVTSYEEVLRIYYGDYMKLPPVEKRRTHGFQTLDFGPYIND